MKNLKSKVFALANRLYSQLKCRSAAMRAAWKLVKVAAGKQKSCSVTFIKKKTKEATTREITTIQGNYEFKGSSKRATPPTLLKFVDVAKLRTQEAFNIISFHTFQITKVA